MIIKNIELQEMDIDLFLISDTEELEFSKRFIAISKDLPETHESFIYTVEIDSLESRQQLIELLLPEDRYIFIQGHKTSNQTIYDMYKNKKGILKTNKPLDLKEEQIILKDFRQFEESYRNESFDIEENGTDFDYTVN